jgi:hypothetical protein
MGAARKLSGRRISALSRRLVKAGIVFALSTALAQESGSPQFTIKPLPLPGAHGLVTLDYFAYDRATQSLWVPASNTGSVDVIDTKTDRIKRAKGFPVAQIEIRGKMRTVGPSSIAIGEGVA